MAGRRLISRHNAMTGLEYNSGGCSVAVADYKEDVRMWDVCGGCIHEIKENRAFATKKSIP